MHAKRKHASGMSLFAFGIALIATQRHAVAQTVACGSIATPDPLLWSDSYGDDWNLAQSADGNVSGDQTGGFSSGCFDNYYVLSGSSEGHGKFVLQMRDENNPPSASCNQSLTYTLTISGSGCAQASGTVTGYPNGPTNFPVTWSDGDGVQAESEIQFFLNWLTNQPALGLFDIDVSPTTYNFSGRQATESFPNGGTDGCYYPGSPIPEWVPEGKMTYVQLDPDNSNGIISGYNDRVGVADISYLDTYRLLGRAPCTLTTQQYVSIDTHSGSEQYDQNTMKIVIGTNTLTVQRGSLIETRPLVSPDVVATLPALNLLVTTSLVR